MSLTSDGHKFLKDLVNYIKRTMHVSEMARIVKYDSATRMANVQPLSIKSDGDMGGMILACPVVRSCSTEKKPLKKGDVVVIVYCDYDLDNFEHGEYTHASDRTHDVNDAIVVGVI